jgi:hypothetical protein
VTEPESPIALREREAREAAVRARRTSVRLGGTGVAVLFLGAFATVLVPDQVALFLVVMGAGFVLVLAAFLVIRAVAPSSGALRMKDLLKGT